MRAIVFNGTEHTDWKRIVQEAPWLKTTYASVEKDARLAKRYHISKNQRRSYVILDDNGNEIIRGRGAVPTEYLTRLIHENKDR